MGLRLHEHNAVDQLLNNIVDLCVVGAGDFFQLLLRILVY